jgi:hypothetical protein
MLINPELGRMTTNDLNRRYQQSFIKYNDQIVYVNGFQGSFITYTKEPEGASSVKFNWKYLDISRPRPRWLQIDDTFVYLAYVMDRQFCRGFSDQSLTTFVPHVENKRFLKRLPISQRLIEEFYKNKPVPRSQTVDQICATLEKFSGVLLSSQLLLHKSQDSMNLYFREEKIGTIGAYSKDYEAELKETIEGLSDENVKRIDGYRRQAIEPAKQEAGVNPARVFVEDGRWNAIPQFEIRVDIAGERHAGEENEEGHFPWGRWNQIMARPAE